MATTEMDIIVKARDDASSTLRRISGSTNSATSSFSKMGSVLKSAAKVGFLALGAAAAVAVAGIKSSIDAASNLNESMSKVGVVFGQSSKDIVNWSKTSASAMGISQQQALESAGTFGNLFTAMKIGEAPAADMSKNLVGLASDLASFNNMDPAEVLDKLRAGIVGEAEPLRSLGVNITAAATQTEAARLGIAKLTDTLTPAQKAQANYSLIFKQSTKAQGDFARTADGVANSQRTVSAEFENAKAAIGKAFLPVWQAVLKGFSTLIEKGKPVIKWVQDLMRGFQEGKGPLKDLAGTIKGVAIDAFNRLIDAIQTLWNDVLKPVFGFIADHIELIGTLAGAVLLGVGAWKAWTIALAIWKAAMVLATIVQAAFNGVLLVNPIGLIIAAVVLLAVVIFRNWGSIKKATAVLWSAIKTGAKAVWGFLKGVFQAVKGVVIGVWNAIKSAAKALWNAVKAVVKAYFSFWKGVFNTAKSIALDVWRAIRDAAKALWSAIKSAASTFFGWIKAGWRGLGEVGKGIWDGVLGAAKTAFNAIAAVWNNTVGRLSFTIPGWVPGIGGAGWDVPDIPTFAKGGIVTRPTLAVIGEAGPEAIVPLGRGRGLGGQNIEIHVDRRRWVEQADYETSYRGW